MIVTYILLEQRQHKKNEPYKNTMLTLTTDYCFGGQENPCYYRIQTVITVFTKASNLTKPEPWSRIHGKTHAAWDCEEAKRPLWLPILLPELVTH